MSQLLLFQQHIKYSLDGGPVPQRSLGVLDDSPPLGPGHPYNPSTLTFAVPGKGGATAPDPQTVSLAIPRLAGMTELVVVRASLYLMAGSTVMNQTMTAASTGGSSVELRQVGVTPGSLTRIDVQGFTPSPVHGVFLYANKSEKYFSWTKQDDGSYAFGRGSGTPNSDGSTRPLHLLVQTTTAAGGYPGPPVAAAPLYKMPGASTTLYNNVLAGVTLALDTPTQGGFSLGFDKPLDCVSATLNLVENVTATGPNEGLPNEGSPLNWKATQIVAYWTSVPRDLDVQVSGGSEPLVQAGQFPGAMPLRPLSLDFTPAARSLAATVYQGTDPLTLTLTFTSGSPGTVEARSIGIDAHYRYAPPAPAPISLRGAPVTVPLPLPGAFTPTAFTFTVDGRFGRGALLEATDPAPPPAAGGVRVADDLQVAFRVPLANDERNLRLLRAGLYGRATGPTELQVSIHRGDGAHIAERLGVPMTLTVAPSLTPDWQRIELPDDPSLLPHPSGVWVVVSANRGVFWWFTTPAADAPMLVSGDGGTTWTAGGARPALQLHKQLARAGVAPLELSWRGRVLAPDLLALTPPLSQLLKIQLPPDEAARRGQADAPALGTTAEDKISATFRVEGIAPVAVSDLAQLKPLDSADFVFRCARDADFRVLDAQLTYDPWKAT